MDIYLTRPGARPEKGGAGGPDRLRPDVTSGSAISPLRRDQKLRTRGGRAQRSPLARHKTRNRGIITYVIIFIIWLCVIGLIVGALARLLLPGRDNIGILGTIVLGIVGSFVGGFLENLIQYHTASVHIFHATGLIGSVIGAFVLLLLLRLSGLERGHRRRRR